MFVEICLLKCEQQIDKHLSCWSISRNL